VSDLRIMRCQLCANCWESPNETPTARASCPRCAAPVCACGCGSDLYGIRADALYRSEACSKRTRRAASPDKARTGHPLQTVREDQATKKHNRDLGGLIRQAIIDQIKTTGECFADDLVGLYPEGEVGNCRRLATAQFGSMVATGLIREKERRRSRVAARKGAKSGVYIFTQKGRETLVGVGGDATSGSSNPHEVAPVTLHSGEAGLTGPGSGAGGASSEDGAPGSLPEPHTTSTASPVQPPAGVSAGRPESQERDGLGNADEEAGTHSGRSSAASLLAAAEPACLPGFEESAAARRLRDAA
jgi:hypothetical protein